MSKFFIEEVIQMLKGGGIGVLPTDTLYGLVGSALNKKAVMRIYRVRRRNLKKPMIVLIGAVGDLGRFGIRLQSFHRAVIKKYWPGPVSIILPCESKKFTYLHRGTKTLAFRLPRDKKLIAFLKKTGPLVAPSANIEGKPPAKTIREAKKYFGDKVDFYLDEGRVRGKPSALLTFKEKKLVRLR